MSNPEVDALEIVLSKLEPINLINKGMELVNAPLMATSLGLVLVFFLVRMVGNVTRNAWGEDSEHSVKALGILVLTCLGLVLYRYAIDLGVTFANGLYQLYEVSGLEQMSEKFEQILDKHWDSMDLWEVIDPGSLMFSVCILFYFISAVLLLVLIAIFGVAHAYCFILLVILGYIVIPMSLGSDKFDLTIGWLKMMLTILLWPFLEVLVFMISSWIMLDVAQAQELTQVDGPDAAAAAALAFTIMNCLMCAAVVYAPKMAAALCNGSGDLAPTLTPFGMASVGAVGAIKGSSLLAKKLAVGSGKKLIDGLSSYLDSRNSASNKRSLVGNTASKATSWTQPKSYPKSNFASGMQKAPSEPLPEASSSTTGSNKGSGSGDASKYSASSNSPPTDKSITDTSVTDKSVTDNRTNNPTNSTADKTYRTEVNRTETSVQDKNPVYNQTDAGSQSRQSQGAQSHSDAEPKHMSSQEHPTQEKSAEDIKKERARKNAIIRQQMPDDRTVSWKPSGHSQGTAKT